MPEFKEPKSIGFKIKNQIRSIHEKLVPNQREVPGTADGVYDYIDVISPLK